MSTILIIHSGRPLEAVPAWVAKQYIRRLYSLSDNPTGHHFVHITQSYLLICLHSSYASILSIPHIFYSRFTNWIYSSFSTTLSKQLYGARRFSNDVNRMVNNINSWKIKYVSDDTHDLMKLCDTINRLRSLQPYCPC